MDRNSRAEWVPLAALSVTVAIAFGVLLYSVSVLITEEAAGAVFSTTVLSAGYGGAVLVGGLAAPLVGRRADRAGVRPVFWIGISTGAAGVTALSVSSEPWHVLASFWLLIGPAGAMTFYEPAFIAVEQWFGSEHRARSLAALTVIGGLAGPIFLPLSSALVENLGWRPASRVLALILLGGGLPAAVLMAQRVPAWQGRTAATRRSVARRLLRDPRFLVYTGSVALMFLCVQAILLHRIALFEAAGFAVATASAGAAAASLLSFPGRFAAPFLARALGGLRIQFVALLVLAGSAVVAVDGSEVWQLVAHVTLFGLAFGAMLPIRASVMGSWYAGEAYGSIMGTQWMVAAVAGAAGPTVVGALRDVTGGYRTPMILVVGGLACAAVLTLISARLEA